MELRYEASNAQETPARMNMTKLVAETDSRDTVLRARRRTVGAPPAIFLFVIVCLATSLGQHNSSRSGQADEAAHTRASVEMPTSDTGGAPTISAPKTPIPPLDPNAYLIGEQDSLLVTVWKEKELSGAVVVRPDGKITVPLVGEVKVVGMTPVQLQTLLAEKLKPFVTVPQVTVAVAEIRSRKVYLIGHTAREGPFAINSTTNVLQIIAQAGGLRDFAKRKKIYILRQNGKEQVRFPFNYDDVLRGKNTQQNILLEPGDTIVVP
jgi:polysaccharide biosynthesis/export protein